MRREVGGDRSHQSLGGGARRTERLIARRSTVRLTCPQYLHDGDDATTRGEEGGFAEERWGRGHRQEIAQRWDASLNPPCRRRAVFHLCSITPVIVIMSFF